MILLAFLLGALTIGIPGYFYLRSLESDKSRLRNSLDVLTAAYNRLSRRMAAPVDEGDVTAEQPAGQLGISQRPRKVRFRSFSAEKQRLESQEPPQRSVNV